MSLICFISLPDADLQVPFPTLPLVVLLLALVPPPPPDLASWSPSSCKYMQSGLGQVWFFIKWLQYFVVPKLVFISRPSIMMLFTLWIALSASLLLMYVTYADAEGPYRSRQM
uniref:Uncharacterized protein n=1 Tax=Anopheles maculatus TaxID=74869 RepID=A0A182SK11_9DIPT